MKQPRLVIVMSYHNNLHDTIAALQKRYDVVLLSPRPIHGSHYVRPATPIQRLTTWKLPWFDYPALYSPQVLWKAFAPPTRYVLTKHATSGRNIVPWLLARWRGITPLTLMQPGVSQTGLVATLARWLGVRFIDIPPCVASDRFRPTQSVDLRANRLRILCVAKYQPRKELVSLLGALRYLRQRWPMITWELTITGAGGRHSEFARVQQHVAQTGLRDSVTLLQNTPAEEMSALYAHHDVFVLPARREPLGYAVLEAMAAGLPVIVSSDVGARCYIQPGQNGWVFPVGSVSELAATIGRLITPDGRVDTTQLTAMGRVGQVIIDKNHSPSVFLQEFTHELAT